MQNKISDILSKQGLKKTKQRVYLLEEMLKSPQPLSAETLYKNSMESGIKLNLSTVYRILGSLSEKGIISTVTISGTNKALYEFNQMLHKHHMVCLCCHKILPIDNCPLSAYEGALAQKTGFKIKGHNLEIYGYCPKCDKT